ncbi:CinA family protein [Bdellovibrio sp. HCB337]|uniref:CinA family protein n=1 Tax=Bdellovibrio sp. HCB337 TaxID=3394358 RepID=UPI0039A414EB
MMNPQTEKLLLELLQLLRTRKFTIGFAESCTGGLLSATLASQAGVSDVFKGSVVSYANEAKMDLLGVQASTLKAEGAVSEAVARQMAQGTRKQLKVDVSVAITGIAGPTGGTPDKPVGTVCFAVAGPGVAEVAQRKQFSGNRSEVQEASVRFALEYLILNLKI